MARNVVDSGTTCLEVGRLLLERPNLHIFSSSVPLLEQAGGSQATLIGIGGEARKASLAMVGALAQSWLGHLRFDCAVIGASGLDLSGAYTTELAEAAIKAEVLRRSSTRLLVTDAEKWNCLTTVHFAPWSAFTYLITNQTVPAELRLKLGAGQVRVAAA